MRAAAILGLGSSMRDLRPFQGESTEWVIGLPPQPEKLDAILIFGGDGTVHRHLHALANLGLPVLVVPAGSGNDFARALGLLRVRDSVLAWRRFVAGRQNVRAVDLGVITPIEDDATKSAPEESGEAARLNGLRKNDRSAGVPPAVVRASSPSRCRKRKGHASEACPDITSPRGAPLQSVLFSCAAGVGLDGEIARRANALPRWLRAHGGYALSLPAALLHSRPFLLKLKVVTTDGASQASPEMRESVRAAIFANAPFYGGGMKIAPRAKMDDGQLDACIIRNISRLKLAAVFPSVYFGRHLGIREVGYFPIERARVETEPPLDVYADGEYVCRTPVEIGIAKSALRVILTNSSDL